MRIAINAQLLPGQGAGGTESALIGLVHSLGQLDDGSEEYMIIGPWEQPDWLAPYLGRNQQIVVGPKPAARFKHVPRMIRPAAYLARRSLMNLLGSEVTSHPPVPMISSGFYEALGCDVIHFPYQEVVITALPSVFSPYDLQHLHFPQFFTPSEIARRELVYPQGCRLARIITVASQWSKNDIVAQYNIAPEKIQVIPLAPPTKAYAPSIEKVQQIVHNQYKLPTEFAFFPAMTWPHKNHLRLLEALAKLRDQQGLRVNLVCTGKQLSHWARIQACLDELQLDDQVQFLGFVSDEHLQALYHLAQFVVIPSLFEGAGLPLLEAWHAERPVACAAATSLIEEAADAALMFDPYSVDSIAQAIRQFATNESQRVEYQQRGIARLGVFSWERTARAYRAVYRQVAGQTLSKSDQELLTKNWMQHG